MKVCLPSKAMFVAVAKSESGNSDQHIISTLDHHTRLFIYRKVALMDLDHPSTNFILYNNRLRITWDVDRIKDLIRCWRCLGDTCKSYMIAAIITYNLSCCVCQWCGEIMDSDSFEIYKILAKQKTGNISYIDNEANISCRECSPGAHDYPLYKFRDFTEKETSQCGWERKYIDRTITSYYQSIGLHPTDEEIQVQEENYLLTCMIGEADNVQPVCLFPEELFNEKLILESDIQDVPRFPFYVAKSSNPRSRLMPRKICHLEEAETKWPRRPSYPLECIRLAKDMPIFEDAKGRRLNLQLLVTRIGANIGVPLYAESKWLYIPKNIYPPEFIKDVATYVKNQLGLSRKKINLSNEYEHTYMRHLLSDPINSDVKLETIEPSSDCWIPAIQYHRIQYMEKLLMKTVINKRDYNFIMFWLDEDIDMNNIFDYAFLIDSTNIRSKVAREILDQLIVCQN